MGVFLTQSLSALRFSFYMLTSSRLSRLPKKLKIPTLLLFLNYPSSSVKNPPPPKISRISSAKENTPPSKFHLPHVSKVTHIFHVKNHKGSKTTPCSARTAARTRQVITACEWLTTAEPRRIRTRWIPSGGAKLKLPATETAVSYAPSNRDASKRKRSIKDSESVMRSGFFLALSTV